MRLSRHTEHQPVSTSAAHLSSLTKREQMLVLGHHLDPDSASHSDNERTNLATKPLDQPDLYLFPLRFEQREGPLLLAMRPKYSTELVSHSTLSLRWDSPQHPLRLTKVEDALQELAVQPWQADHILSSGMLLHSLQQSDAGCRRSSCLCSLLSLTHSGAHLLCFFLSTISSPP